MRALGHDALALNLMVDWTKLAGLFGLHRSTVQREVEGNGGRFWYRAALAEQRAQRCRRRARLRVVDADPVLRERLDKLVRTTV